LCIVLITLDAIFYFQIKNINNNKKDYYYNSNETNATNKYKRNNNKINFAQIFCYRVARAFDSAINYRKIYNKQNMFKNKYVAIISNCYCILLVLFLSFLIRKCVLYCDLKKNREKQQTRAKLLLTKKKQKTTQEKREKQKSKQEKQKQIQKQTQK